MVKWRGVAANGGYVRKFVKEDQQKGLTTQFKVRFWPGQRSFDKEGKKKNTTQNMKQILNFI